MYALVDCNNFYASCERLFRPDLQNKPIIVLSNNDGCIIARSGEAKVLGIGMGEPFFKIKALCKQHQVHVFSSNYTFYGDMSQRVMSVIEDSWPNVEIYSIDEAFLDLKSLPASQQEAFCHGLEQKIVRYTGIPVSIGIGPTKTLAKLANHIAKKELKIPVFNIDNQRFWLSRIAIGDVWGIGRQWSKKLSQQGINTAFDLASIELCRLKQLFYVMVQRTALELSGVVCAGLDEFDSRKSIIASKSFGQMQTAYTPIAQAVSSHCARACEKLREQNLLVGHMSVFIQTNRFRLDLPQYNYSIAYKLEYPTDDLRSLTHRAKFCLRQMFRPGFHYQKAGICFTDLISKEQVQMDLFNQPSDEQIKQSEQLMSVWEAINNKYGRHTLRLAAEGRGKSWEMRSELRSPSYTTKWSDLPLVRL